MGNFYLSSDLFTKVQATISIPFIPREATSPRNSLASSKIKVINQMERASRFGRTRATKSIGWRNWCATRAEERWKARKSAPITAPAIMHFSSKTRTEINWKFAVGKVQSLRNERISAKSLVMSNPAHVPAILQEPRRHRYLKLIALFKIGKGVLLLLLGVSLLFLNARSRWMDALSNWTADEILLEHSRGVAWLLHKLQAVLADGAVRVTGFLALFYAAVLFTEGIGVYMQQRWAELLMVFATASLIPIEIRHLWHRPGLVGALILLANCFIVWFLYQVLKREKPDAQIARQRELVETV